MALDVVVTSGMNTEMLTQFPQDVSAAVTRYEDFQRSHLDTARTCAVERSRILSMITEAHCGGWRPVAEEVFAKLAQSKSL